MVYYTFVSPGTHYISILENVIIGSLELLANVSVVTFSFTTVAVFS